MREERLAEMRKGYRHALIFGGIGSVGPLFIYALIFEIIKYQGAIHPAENTIKSETALAVMAGLALLSAVLHKPLAGIFMKTGLMPNTYAPKRFSPSVQKMIATTILVPTVFHTIGVVGFVFSFLTQRRDFVYLGIVLSLILTVLYYPRFEQWEEWAGKIGPDGWS